MERTKTQWNYDNQSITLREKNLDNTLLLTSQFSNTLNVIEHVSVTTKVVSDTPHTNNGQELHTVVSQTKM